MPRYIVLYSRGMLKQNTTIKNSLIFCVHIHQNKMARKWYSTRNSNSEHPEIVIIYSQKDFIFTKKIFFWLMNNLLETRISEPWVEFERCQLFEDEASIYGKTLNGQLAYICRFSSHVAKILLKCLVRIGHQVNFLESWYFGEIKFRYRSICCQIFRVLAKM